MNRETITAALFTRLTEKLTGLKKASRRPKSFEEIAASDCPAMFLAIGDSNITKHEMGQRPLWNLTWTVYLYAHESASVGPSSQINSYLGQIEAALAATTSEITAGNTSGPQMTTLGGLCQYVRLSSVITDEGSFGDLGMAIVTIDALVVG